MSHYTFGFPQAKIFIPSDSVVNWHISKRKSNLINKWPLCYVIRLDEVEQNRWTTFTYPRTSIITKCTTVDCIKKSKKYFILSNIQYRLSVCTEISRESPQRVCTSFSEWPTIGVDRNFSAFLESNQSNSRCQFSSARILNRSFVSATMMEGNTCSLNPRIMFRSTGWPAGLKS